MSPELHQHLLDALLIFVKRQILNTLDDVFLVMSRHLILNLRFQWVGDVGITSIYRYVNFVYGTPSSVYQSEKGKAYYY